MQVILLPIFLTAGFSMALEPGRYSISYRDGPHVIVYYDLEFSNFRPEGSVVSFDVRTYPGLDLWKRVARPEPSPGRLLDGKFEIEFPKVGMKFSGADSPESERFKGVVVVGPRSDGKSHETTIPFSMERQAPANLALDLPRAILRKLRARAGQLWR